MDQDVSNYIGAADLWLIKISPAGELLWEKTIGGTSFDVARAIVKTQDNGFLLAGSSEVQMLMFKIIKVKMMPGFLKWIATAHYNGKQLWEALILILPMVWQSLKTKQ
ncbi:hypothetical protein N7U66_13995 [Lacinutrix neustonica]|uniref:Uncharacterized protein n=1 Tax=Lacinutrix neustonica TaxID=2980107 RepID=A0A9E8MUD6_9FLAO|nr:hypothetical protein [Lacinutrix neustonica]WAC01231.1 hypothetical protein N7U66_13995 [Lacinutrix neustonica]